MRRSRPDRRGDRRYQQPWPAAAATGNRARPATDAVPYSWRRQWPIRLRPAPSGADSVEPGQAGGRPVQADTHQPLSGRRRPVICGARRNPERSAQALAARSQPQVLPWRHYRQCRKPSPCNDVAIGGGKASSDPKFYRYLCAVADWRLQGNRWMPERPSILKWEKFLAQFSVYWTAETAARKEIIEGNVHYYSTGELPACVPSLHAGLPSTVVCETVNGRRTESSFASLSRRAINDIPK